MQLNGAPHMLKLNRAARVATRNMLSALLPLAYKTFYRGRPIRAAAGPEDPKRILVLNGAHIGDIVISTSILPILKSAYPNAQIGFATGSWSQMVLKDHPDVDFIHCVDHWWINRNGKSLFSKLRHFWQTRSIALGEIREIRYDMALCIYPFPIADFMEIAWCAGIPVRLGFRRSLYRSLATFVTEVPENPFLTEGAVQAEVLRPLCLDKSHLHKRKAILPESRQEAIREVCDLLNVTRIEDSPYRVIHMGSGVLNRELPLTFWREVAEELAKTHTVVFTGKGDRETANAAHVCSGLSGCINACDRLSWNGFVAAIRLADVLYGVESMAGHVAAAVGTRSISAYTAMSGVARWRPESSTSTVFTKHLSCAPCENAHGCRDMTCLRGVSPRELMGAIQERSVSD
jgi:ADP-heptose:LPS heptosyltransferase